MDVTNSDGHLDKFMETVKNRREAGVLQLIEVSSPGLQWVTEQQQIILTALSHKHAEII